MNKVKLHKNNRDRRIVMIKSKLSQVSTRPRLCVFRSNKYLYAQIIDDVKGATLVDGSKNVKKIHEKVSKVQAAHNMGLEIAKLASQNKITQVVFDRRGYKYHGRVKSFAEGAREGGLDF